MADNTKNHLTRMLLSKSRRAQYAKAFVVLAACVAIAVAVILHQNGVAMVHEEQVLTCPVEERILDAQAQGETPPLVAHTHDDSCYDENGNLVCGLPERDLHIHDESCYTEITELTCGLDESDEHQHDDNCYTTTYELTCGEDEVTEEHRHGQGCFTTVTVDDGEPEETDVTEQNADSEQDDSENTSDSQGNDDKDDPEAADGNDDKDDPEAADGNDDKDDKDDPEAADGNDDKDDKDDKDDPEAADGNETIELPAQSFEHSLLNNNDKEVLHVTVEAPEGAFPEGTTMEVTHVKSSEVADVVSEAMTEAGDKRGVDSMMAVDIVFRNAEGDEIEPGCPITVSMVSDKIADEDTSPVLVHVDDEGKGEIIDQLSDAQAAKRNVESGNDAIAFDSDAFSVYIIVYTVDFHWEVDGEKFEFSLPGGGFVSFTDLVEVLGIAEGTSSGGSAEGSKDLAGEDALALSGITVSDKTKKFVTDVESVEFSSPDLVWVGKVETDSTVGHLKTANGLDVQYSAELSKEQIKEINEQTVKSGDWALISKLPFQSEESLTVTMISGDVFTIKVTDAQYTGTVVPAEDLDGKTGALVNKRNNNAVLDVAHTSQGRLQAAAVTIGADNSITTTDSGVQLTEWTFTKAEGTAASYYVHTSRGYLNISNSSVSVDKDNRQPLEISRDNNNRIRIRNNNGYALNNHGNNTGEGYFGYLNGGNDNRGEWFTIYSIEQILPIKLHFVDTDGQILEAKYADGTAVDENNIDLSKLVIGDDGIIDLNQFTVNGCTLSNTHKSTWHDIEGSSYPHTIIGNELKWNGSTIQYRLFYTNNDKAGSYWFDAGTEPMRDDHHWVYNGSDPSNHTAVSDDNSKPYDYYLVYSPVPDESTGTGQTSQESTDDSLDDLGKSKALTPNNDGTYTLDLSVTTDAKGHEESNGINLIILFDTSSSMTRSVQNDTNKYTDYKTNPDSRFYQAKKALDDFLDDLGEYNTADNPNAVQLALIDFNQYAYTHTFGTSNSYWTTDTTAFKQTVSNLNCPSGTNWAQALELAMTVKAQADSDPTYVLLMTDGAPSQYWGKNDLSTSYFVSGEGCYLGARDEAREVILDDMELYGIFSFGIPTDRTNDYLGKLVDYAYDADVKSGHRHYAESQDALEEALTSILGVLREKVAHIAVNIHDGIALDTTSTALSANINGTLGSITYSKTGGTTPAYTVKTNHNGEATFIIDGTEHQGTMTNKSYTKISGTTADGGSITTSSATANVYSCRVGAGDDAKTYIMPIALLNNNEDTKVGDLNWDLSPLGLLEDGATYKISFVVWPNQEAYDYVADLNNDIQQWDTSKQKAVYTADGTKVLYYKEGVEEYPNIVYDPSSDTYAVLTNTEQDVTYYVSKEDRFDSNTNSSNNNSNPDTEYSGKYTTYPDTPDPMPLTATQSQIEKIWNVDRDPGILAQLLYNDDGEIKYYENGDGTTEPYHIDFEILKGAEKSRYTYVTLGWHKDTDHENGGYFGWDSTSVRTHTFTDRLTGETHDVQIGTRWIEDVAISTGLMLSEDRMDALGLDKSFYPSTTYKGTRYYILEEGHDYTIKEPNLTYEFDFSEPTYHPMLVDGVLKNVSLTKTDQGNNASYSITKMESIVDSAGKSSLKVENTLRGYINLKKEVVDLDGQTPVKDDNTQFTYNVVMENESGPFTVEDDSVPWYGVNGLFYHDEEFNYYQASKSTSGSNIVTLQDEDNNTYIATSNDFNEKVGPATLTYTSEGTEKTIRLFGNQMNHDNDKKVSATLKITQNQTLSISNVPTGTTYSITEAKETGYDLVSIEYDIDGNAASGQASIEIDKTAAKITGGIVDNHNNNIKYTNKTNVVDINVQKLDDKGKGLEGAVFQLRKLDDNNSYVLATDVGGLGTVSSYQCAFESTGEAQTLTRLSNGTYRLYEVHVPNGYIKTYEYIQFEIKNREISSIMTDTNDDTKLKFTPASVSGETATLALIQIKNEPGAALPYTGGSGTQLFTTLGSILITGAATLLVMRRRIRA